VLKKNHFHFSVDDVFASLIEITDKNIPLKNHWFFKQLYNLWSKYQIKTSCNLFYEGFVNGNRRSLVQVRSIKDEIREGWLYFGPHALNIGTPPYKQTNSNQIKTFDKIYNEIDRFAGTRHRCSFLRLHYYSESYQLANYWKKNKIKGIFTTDRKVGCHTMPKYIANELIKNGVAKYKETNLIRTDFRIEFLSKKKMINKKKIINIFEEKLKEKSFIIIYSHEYELKKKINKHVTLHCASVLTYKIKLKNSKP
jgi:hypothetical protein